LFEIHGEISPCYLLHHASPLPLCERQIVFTFNPRQCRNDNIVGLSAGGGTPQGFEENDLSASSDCGDPIILGDVNGDGLVDVADILAVVDAWGPCLSCPEDLNGDGFFDVVDLLEVVGNWT
jgi:hypothetical protein